MNSISLQTSGRSALFFAADNGHDVAVAILLAYGADPHQTDLVLTITLIPLSILWFTCTYV